jgi:hypothetical protein
VLLSRPYAALASHLATALAGAKIQADAAKSAKTGTWAGFKSAVVIGRDNGHSASVMRTGLEVACVDAGIPSGSFRGYISTVESLAADVFAGELSMAELEAISVKDARERYMDADKKAVLDARAKLNEATKGWNAEQLLLLASIAAESNAPEAEAEDAAEEPQAATG